MADSLGLVDSAPQTSPPRSPAPMHRAVPFRFRSTQALDNRVFDLQGPMIIAIDGPAGTGKSSVARQLAAALGLDFLDTGAMYRAAALVAIEHDLWHDDSTRRDEDAVRSLITKIREAEIRFDWTTDPPTILAFGSDVSNRIRTGRVNDVVSPISAIKALREVMVEKQRRIGAEHPRLVTEGRDQGSVVFPQAPVKFYLDARPDVRARRRAEQLRQAGAQADEPAILREIIERDERDMTRQDGRLVCPPDAIRVDTSDIGMDRVISTLVEHVRERAAADR